MKRMTDKEYIENAGADCPYCRSKNISTCSEFDGEGGAQDVECFDCGKIWRDFYQLKGYEQVA